MRGDINPDVWSSAGHAEESAATADDGNNAYPDHMRSTAQPYRKELCEASKPDAAHWTRTDGHCQCCIRSRAIYLR